MKKRLDSLAYEQGLADSRTKAAALVMAGLISAEGKVLPKAGQLVDDQTTLELKNTPQYVSRAGNKLASAVAELKLNFNNQTVLDVGASTGGFTDLALQQGAKQIFAVDVGTGQLAYKLRQDPRVIVMERTDIRRVQNLPELVDIALIDVSFISLTNILDHVTTLIKPDGLIVAMAKPQFESGKKIADQFKGIIKNETVRNKVLQDFEKIIREDFIILNKADSKIAGAKGNIERFYVLRVKR